MRHHACFFFVKEKTAQNATEYYWKSSSGKNIKHVLYTITQNEMVYYVREEYDAGGGLLEYVYIWFADAGMYADICVDQPAEPPTEEWVTSFGIKPYEP